MKAVSLNRVTRSPSSGRSSMKKASSSGSTMADVKRRRLAANNILLSV
eukprot:CAMPEP_0170487270 /NCGR_PEP_ID=MMETSP0208-20121228/6128_1 /TAXON_ID=197538 /ORGANISM="Strombidium inclinatum, Strain S3" /LENGTH=47 /DNA_ID= /DNA_START= /DNA_END= /DNA_ORIENTATION=